MGLGVTRTYGRSKGDEDSETGADGVLHTRKQSNRHLKYRLSRGGGGSLQTDTEWSQVTIRNKTLGPSGTKYVKREYASSTGQPRGNCYKHSDKLPSDQIQSGTAKGSRLSSPKQSDTEQQGVRWLLLYGAHCQNGPLMQLKRSWVLAVPLVEEKRAGIKQSSFHREVCAGIEGPLGPSAHRQNIFQVPSEDQLSSAMRFQHPTLSAPTVLEYKVNHHSGQNLLPPFLKYDFWQWMSGLYCATPPPF